MVSLGSLDVVTYNVYGGGEFSEQRLVHIVKEILSSSGNDKCRPDVIFLQEATLEIVHALLEELNRPHSEPHTQTTPESSEDDVGLFRCVTKLDFFEVDGLENTSVSVTRHSDNWVPKVKRISPSELHEVRQSGFLATITRLPLRRPPELLHHGGWLDDGILKVDVELGRGILETGPSIFLVLYNYHGSGGSFAKPPEVLERKQRQRREELGVLNRDVATTLSTIWGECHERQACAIVAGDFNADFNDAANYPEAAELFPEVVLNNETFNADQTSLVCYDIWARLRHGEIGNTESHSRNTFRAFLKPGQDREATFDRIVLAKGSQSPEIDATSIDLIGTHRVGKVTRECSGKGFPGQGDLFPSDHFGLRATIGIK